MSVSANITAPEGTQSGNFNVTVTFASAVEDFAAADITLTAVSGNGTTGVTFQVPGSGATYATYNVPFQLPKDTAGSLRISITGQVTVTESGVSESVTAMARKVVYDTKPNVTEVCGDAEYRDDGTIVQPIKFSEKVIVPSKSVFDLARVSGDALDGIIWYIVGENTDFEIVFAIPSGRRGSFLVRPVGNAFKVSTQVWAIVEGDPKLIPYNTR